MSDWPGRLAQVSLEIMKKRLSKKKHIGEFAEWGRQLVAFRNTKMDAQVFQDAFLVEAIEGNGSRVFLVGPSSRVFLGVFLVGPS